MARSVHNMRSSVELQSLSGSLDSSVQRWKALLHNTTVTCVGALRLEIQYLKSGNLIHIGSELSLNTSRLHNCVITSVLPKNSAIIQLGPPAVLNIRSDGHTVYISFIQLANKCGSIIAKDCLSSATAMYI